MIHSLSHSIEAKVKENGELQQSWLRLQEELLSLTKRASELRDENQDTRLKINLLTRKRIQIDQTFSKEEALTRSLKKSLNALHTEMTRLNTLIHTEGKHGEAVRESTLNLQQEFRGKLQDAERASIQLEQRIADLQAEKERTLSDLLYAERQILLWEKKIQLAKETQAALDPDVGAAEMKEMKAEIYRMQLKHASLLKLQQKMVADMERNITRHETITSRSINQQQRSDAKSQAQSSLRRAIDEMGKKLRQTLSDVDEVEGQLNTVRAAVMEMEEQLQATERAFAELGEAAEASRRAIADRQLLRRLCMHGTLIHQRQARRYNEFALQKYVPLFRDAEKRSLERGVVGQRVQEVCALLTEVDQQYGSSFQVTLAPLHAFAAEHLTTKSK
ncbi:hypothetical protein CXG81DRAFT_9365 [Caulochytrium protostelioides]|uniref:Coiled-coil domain-containing protein 40 n=1 Tax=Caulochytrium protostelioides TaxID=1555241 RepID=A0A4P9XDK7_9FUNG|nr:hypothetical protein CXG81DRAFT_9365 [Caulochytrium protostelioides]|eukprot:RKP03553.1 hypothetical protein CXG81DRAFT_9365 [Caulochytrium protostelioides]